MMLRCVSSTEQNSLVALWSSAVACFLIITSVFCFFSVLSFPSFVIFVFVFVGTCILWKIKFSSSQNARIVACCYVRLILTVITLVARCNCFRCVFRCISVINVNDEYLLVAVAGRYRGHLSFSPRDVTVWWVKLRSTA